MTYGKYVFGVPLYVKPMTYEDVTPGGYRPNHYVVSFDRSGLNNARKSYRTRQPPFQGYRASSQRRALSCVSVVTCH